MRFEKSFISRLINAMVDVRSWHLAWFGPRRLLATRAESQSRQPSLKPAVSRMTLGQEMYDYVPHFLRILLLISFFWCHRAEQPSLRYIRPPGSVPSGPVISSFLYIRLNLTFKRLLQDLGTQFNTQQGKGGGILQSFLGFSQHDDPTYGFTLTLVCLFLWNGL